MTTQGGSYSWNAVCDVCGFRYKAQDLKRRWDGLMVCSEDFETRHPLDFYRVKNDHHPLPFTRQEPMPNSGFLPLSGYTTYANTAGDGKTIGSKFTVGTSDRTLMGVTVGGDVINNYVLGSPVKVKLWSEAGALLYTWLVNIRYPAAEIDTISFASIPLLPGYTLSASTSYRISVWAPTGEEIVTNSAITSAQPYLTYVASYSAATDAFPNTALTTTQATPHLDVLTTKTT